MIINPLIEFVRRFRRPALLQEGEELSDGQLLERFVRSQDVTALEALVRRHAPLVWGVCRRTLARPADAEDAFQATFLVFLRKAASIRSRELLANWLYGVASKTARKARQQNAIRSSREKQVETMPEPPTEPHDHAFGSELWPLVDQELSRLPEKYRIAIVLCDLQGNSHRAVAQQLGIAEGTVGSRLARGRAILAQRLSRYGVGESPTILAVALPQQATSGAVPAALLTRTIEAASLLAEGKTVAAGLLSAAVSSLTEGVLQATAVARLMTASVCLVVSALVLVGVAIGYPMLPGPWSKPGQNENRDVEKYGSEADAKEFAKKNRPGPHYPQTWNSPGWAPSSFYDSNRSAIGPRNRALDRYRHRGRPLRAGQLESLESGCQV